MCSIGDAVSAVFELREQQLYMYNINAIIPKSHSDVNLWGHIGNNGLAKRFNLQ